jgi:hypothetical protein
MSDSVAFVTYKDQPEITADDALAAEALREVAGLEVQGVSWDDPHVDWSAFTAIVLRSMWDYFHRPDEFRRWLSQIEAAQACVFNSPALARWNMEKTYMRELEAAGIPAVPTFWATKGEVIDVPAVLEERGWDTAVIKPTISGAAHETWVTMPAEAGVAAERERVRQLSERGGVMIQPFMDEIVTFGEWSHIFINGEHSHSIVKSPADGDFRVQAQFGASRRSMSPSPNLLEKAVAALRSAMAITHEPTPLYARVDGVETRDGRFVLMELEVIEPVLSFAADPHAAPERFARGVVNRLQLAST